MTDPERIIVDALNMLRALKTRAEAAEASASDGWGQRNAIYAELTKAQTRTEAAEKALKEIATECSTFPIKNGLAFRCESIARAALEVKP